MLIRGHTTPGYLNNPEETARAFRPDGFFDTGDLGRFDADGRFIFHSRLKEVIKSGGINVSPVEVEQLIVSHPDIRDAYVVGVADPVRGELVVAFVDAVARIGESKVQAYVKERAASFKVPHHVLFRSEGQLPRLPQRQDRQAPSPGGGAARIGRLTGHELPWRKDCNCLGVGASRFERRPEASVLEFANTALESGAGRCRA